MKTNQIRSLSLLNKPQEVIVTHMCDREDILPFKPDLHNESIIFTSLTLKAHKKFKILVTF